jgi:hypothetical protein
MITTKHSIHSGTHAGMLIPCGVLTMPQHPRPPMVAVHHSDKRTAYARAHRLMVLIVVF